MMNPKYLEIYKSNNVYPAVNNTFPNFEIYNLSEPPILSNNERVVNKDTPLKAPAERKKGKSRLVDLPSFSSFVKGYANKHGIAYKEAIKSQEVKDAYRSFRGSNNLEVSVLNPNPMNLKLAFPSEASNTYLDKRFNIQPQYAPVNFGPSEAFLQRTSVKFQAYENLKNATKEIATDFIKNLSAADTQEVNKFKGSINKILPLSEEMQAKLFKEIDASNKGLFAYSVFPDLISKFNFEEFSDKQNRPLIYTPLSNRSSIISRNYLDGVQVQLVNNIPNLENVDSVYFNFGGLFNENFNSLLNLYEPNVNISRPFKFYFADSRKIDNLQDLYRTMPQNVLDYLITGIAGINDPQDFTEVKKYLRTGKDVDLTIQTPPNVVVRTSTVPQAPNLPPGIVKGPSVAEQLRQQLKEEFVTLEEAIKTKKLELKNEPVPVSVATPVDLGRVISNEELITKLQDKLTTLLNTLNSLVKDDFENGYLEFQVSKKEPLYQFKKGDIIGVQTNKIINLFEVLEDVKEKDEDIKVYGRESFVRGNKYKVNLAPFSSGSKIYSKNFSDIQGISPELKESIILKKYSKSTTKINDLRNEINKLSQKVETKVETKGEGFNLKGGSLDTALLEFKAKVGIASIENLGKSGNDYIYRININ